MSLISEKSQLGSSAWSHPVIRAIPYALILFVCAYYTRVADGDLFHLAASGRLIARDGWPALVDPFAYTVTKPVWVDHEWLSALVLYGVSQIGGDLSLFLFTCFLAYLTVLALLWAQDLHESKRCGFNSLLFLSLFPCSFIWNSTIRPLTLSFLLFAVLLATLEVYRQTGKRIALFMLPVVFLLWGNAHGSFIVGLGYLGVTVGCRLASRSLRGELVMVCVFLVSCLAACTTPYGWHFVTYISHAVIMPRPLVPEWASMPLCAANLIFYGIALLTLFALGTSARRLMPTEVRVFLVISLLAAIKHERHAPFFFFIASVYLPASLGSRWCRLRPWVVDRVMSIHRVCHGLWLAGAVIGLFALARFVINARAFQLDYSRQPVETFAWLARHARGGNVLLHFNHGSYVLLYGYPRFKVSLDARYEEVYPHATVERVLRALQPGNENFIAAFREVRPEFILVCRDTMPPFNRSSFPGTWQEVFTGDGGRCSVFVEDLSLVASTESQEVPHRHWQLTF